MKEEAPYAIGSFLKHHSGVIIKLQRYDTQLVPSSHQSIGGENIKRVPNYNYLYGIEVATNKNFKGLTKEFELVNP